MKNFPTLDIFLDSKLETIKDLIQSLGLLKRAIMLNDLALQIKNEFNNKIPKNFSELKTLKGIGNYGANAILCFGFNEKRPLLDTNFIRIYKRVFNVISKTKTPKTDKFLWNFSEELLPEKKIIEFNYGILDLGGTICLNKNPKCSFCPLNEICNYCNKIKKELKRINC